MQGLTAPEPGLEDPLGPAERAEIAAARIRCKKIASASRVAAFNVWSTGIFAALALPFALFSGTALVMCLGLGLVTWNELRGRRLLQRFEPEAARVLGWNQVALMGLLIGYGAWGIYSAFTAPNPYEPYMRSNPELRSMLGSLDEMYAMMALVVYGCVIVGSVIFQGLNSLYYFTRRRHIEAYRAETPAWVVRLQAMTAGA
ncbi:MAG: hypothetical protein CMJ18_11490 [Phycisphaeraceae bacterium]|nr:hypothetical protein [Phycisphaeraceae bacterium]